MEKKQPGTETATDNLQSNLLVLYKEHCKCVPIYLLRPTWKHPVRNLYVDQELKIADHLGKPGSENDGTVAFRDIFYKDGRRCTNVYVTGQSGVGKSAFCEHLAKLWYDAHTTPDTTNLTEDQKSMLEFKLLFYINLRDATLTSEDSKTDEIALLIHDLLGLQDSCSVTEIHKCLCDPSTLVVIDSIDELGPKILPRRDVHNKSCIVTTSRPWKIGELRSLFQGNINQHIEILGLRKGSSEKFAEKILKILNKEFSQAKTGNQFIQKIENEGLHHFLNIPSLVIQMLSLWYDDGSIGNSQSEIYGKIIHHQILAAVKAKEFPGYVGKSKHELPFCCSSEQCPCKTYGELLWKVAKLAWHTLFGGNRRMWHAYDDEVTTSHGLLPEDIDSCLKIGILTQNSMLVKNLTVGKTYVSFIHMTNQEYFASVFLSTIDQRLDLQYVCSVISDMDRALELDKVLFFCSQLKPEVARQLSQVISIKTEADQRVQEYRQSCDRYNVPNAELIMAIQNFILPATQQNTKLFLSDIYLYESERSCNIDVSGLDTAGVKSMHIETQVDATTWTTLKRSRCLEKLFLDDSEISVESAYEMILANKDTLRTLGLYWLDLSSLGETLTEIFNGNQLTSLGLEEVELCHTQCQFLLRHFSTTGNLRQVSLDALNCTTHSCQSACLSALDIDFTRHTRLNKVMLRFLPFTKATFSVEQLQEFKMNLPGNVSAQTSALRCLRTANNLQVLACRRLGDFASVTELLTVLGQLESLQRIKLSRIRFGSLREIRLSAAVEKLEFIRLGQCTIESECLRCLVKNLHKFRVEVVLFQVTIKGTENVLQEIRDSPDTDVTDDVDAVYENDKWKVWKFKFYTKK